MLAAAPPDGGAWTSPKVPTWMAERVGRPVSKQRAWEAMRSLGFTRQRPRPRATTDPEAQEAFKKGLHAAVHAVTAAPPDATVAIWAHDEHRLGVLPVVRRVWAHRGARPIAPVQRRDQRLDVYGFVRPTTGQSWWCLLPTVTTAAMSAALAEFARDESIDARHRAILVWDRAGWHTSPNLALPDGIDLVAFAAASPELQPAGRLWPLRNEPVANRTFADLDALEATLVTRCRTLRADRRTIRNLTHSWWWPSAPPAAIPDSLSGLGITPHSTNAPLTAARW